MTPKHFLLSAILTSILISATLPSAEGIVRRHDVNDQEYLDFGSLYPSVGMLTSGSSLGSGVLIDSRWVLTAAHLQSGDSAPNQFEIGDGLYTVSEFHTHPGWDTEADPNDAIRDGNDIALARLAEPVASIIPSTWYTGSDERGRIGVSVGFGNTGTGLTGQQSGTAGTKRAAESLIVRDDDRGGPGPPQPTVQVDTTLEYDFLSPDDAGVLDLEGSAAQGDSGGPVFIDFGDGPLVAGIHSFVINRGGDGLATYGDTVASTRVSLYDDWILATIPEPRTWGLLAGSAVLLLVISRRRSIVTSPSTAAIQVRVPTRRS